MTAGSFTVGCMSCTTILVGKQASINGSTIIARNDDSGSGRYDPKRFVAVTPDQQPRHYHSVLSHVEIELPDNPCHYSMFPNVLPNRGILAEAGANEYNVAMSATETIAVNERVLAADPFVEYQAAVGKPGDAEYQPEVPGGIGEEDIITLVLPYVHTAQEGVLRLGKLLEQVGTYEANGVIFSDPDNIWYMETIGGHHWIARRVPDNAYATIPNQLGIDTFNMHDAFGEQREYMCSADLAEFITHNALDLTMPASNSAELSSSSATVDLASTHIPSASISSASTSSAETALANIDAVINTIGNNGVFNPRHAFGTATTKDHIYNTPRAWYMQRYLNPSIDWDSEHAQYTPTSDNIPWCQIPERKISIEDIEFLMSSHFEGTPYDPYGTLGTPESRHRYRTIGINRTGHMVAIEHRHTMPSALATVYWVSFGSGPFTAVAPFYANVHDTPSYLRDTTAEATTDSLYWTNRIIAALADSHYHETSNAIEAYREQLHAFGHRHIAHTDQALLTQHNSDTKSVRNNSADNHIQHTDTTITNATKSTAAMITQLETANIHMAEELHKRTNGLLHNVLYTVSNLMHNSFILSDRWA